MSSTSSESPPNVILIHCDELRYPVHFPDGVDDADQFMAQFMPLTHRLLWQEGVKFVNHQIASCACTPSRGVMVTGLYSQQTYLMATRASLTRPQVPVQPQPELQSEFPTYGKIMRELGYDTPYIGKWHLSNSGADPSSPVAHQYLDAYGFDAVSVPDPLGLPGQGVGAVPPSSSERLGQALSDASISAQAVGWLRDRATNGTQKPFCLTIGFVNPHDQQFFWAGTEGNRYKAVYQEHSGGQETPGAGYQSTVVIEAHAPNYGYHLPSNWETEQRLEESSPKLHRVAHDFFAYYMTGDISDDPQATDFTLKPSQAAKGKQMAVAPFSYWTKALDVYTKLMGIVDEQIAQVVVNIPPALLEKSVILFTSDHGDYVASHGMVGKAFSLYKESLHVPLLVRDFTGTIATDPAQPRNQLTSHVDLLALLVSLGQGGTRWMDESPYAALYGKRARLYDILTNPKAPGRRHALHATDEPIIAEINYLKAPEHVVGVITEQGKLGSYSYWDIKTDGTTPLKDGMEVEYYDYNAPDGISELNSTPEHPDAQALLKLLLEDLIPNELQAPLPEPYQAAQQKALQAYWRYIKTSNLKAIVSGLTG